MGHPALFFLHSLLSGSGEIAVKEERGKTVLLVVSGSLSLS